MKNIMTILKRELASYFNSTIAYIFIVVFLLVSVGLYITPFFTFPRAEMRQFFGMLPIIMAIFIPAVTMRLWSEDRKENTWEMLLTFPMKASELVLGKFMASMAFFCVVLVGTLTVPIMLAWLGDPDSGPIIGAYFGTVLLGAFYMSMGIFFSGLCKDQIVAFVITLLACFAVYLLGTEMISSYIDSVWSGMGSTLGGLIGVTGHYDAFSRGVIEIGDVLFFFIWTVIFLGLNSAYIEGRFRPGARMIFSITVAVSIGIGIAFNWVIADRSIKRFDLTEDKIYTVSTASQEILRDLKVPVQIKLYITPKQKMPTGMKQLEQDVIDKLEEMKVASKGNVVYSTIHMEAANVIGGGNEDKSGKEEKIEKQLLDKGVKPFSVRAIDKDEVTNKLVYSSIGIAYKEKEEEILPQIMPQNLIDLEYMVINTIYKTTRDKRPRVAMVAPIQDLKLDPQMIALYQRMGKPIPRTEDPYAMLQQLLEHEKYEVNRVKLSQFEPMPDTDTVVVINPRELNERQLWEINRALVEGKNVFMAIQMYNWDYQVNRDTINIAAKKEDPKINDILKEYGITVDDEILLDSNHQPLTISDPNNPMASMMGQGMTLNIPIQIQVNSDTMNQDVSITNRLSAIFYLWGSALSMEKSKLKENNLKSMVLMNSGKTAWKIPGSQTLKNADLKPPANAAQYPLAVMVTGQFPDIYEDKDKPEWPKEQPRPGMPPAPKDDGPPGPVQKKPGKLILVGCANMFKRNMMGRSSLDLFMNCVDAMTLGEKLIDVRSNKPIDRTITKPSDTSRTVWKAINLVLVNMLIAIAGILWALYRKRSRESYRVKQA